MMKYLVTICRILVGLLFIFSGLIKINDPLGFGYKLQEYFEVFNLMFLYNFATAIAVFLCALEIVLGVLLLLGIKTRLVSWGLLLLIIFFTFLTFYSAYFDVVRTCGCFGDAIPLTPWQSFSKDLVLLLLIVVIFINRDRIYPLVRSEKAQNNTVLIVSVCAIACGLYTYNYSPVIDFLPYKIGANIPEQMKVPVGAPQDEYVITYQLLNKKTGARKQMTDKEYLKTEIWKDSNWEIKGDPERQLVKKGFEAKIKDLKITDAQGTDYTTEIIENPYHNIVIVAYDLKRANVKAIGDLNAIAINAAENYNIRTVLLTSSSAQEAEAFRKQHKLVMEMFYADAVPLKSMVRANPGVILLKKGTVVNKWHFHLMPDYNVLEKNYFLRNE